MTEKSQLLEELQEEDLYIKYKKLTRHLEMLEIQEGYIKDEQANLKRELIRAQEEVKRIQNLYIDELLRYASGSSESYIRSWPD